MKQILENCPSKSKKALVRGNKRTPRDTKMVSSCRPKKKQKANYIKVKALKSEECDL